MNQRTARAKLLLVLSTTCGLGLTPFIFFRATQQNWTMVALDIAVVISMTLIFIFVYRTNKTIYPSLWFLFIVQVGSFTSFYINGGYMINWVYPAMLSTFGLIKPRYALAINFIILLIYFPKLIDFFEVIEIMAIALSVSISNIIAFRFAVGLREQKQELIKLAAEDCLTATGNRRALNLHLDELWIKLQGDKAIASLIILDLDHFKKVNDVYGHMVGDKALVNLSNLIKTRLEDSNPIFRYGGEEFLIVCSGCVKQDAYQLAEEIRKEVKKADLIKQSKITISLGVAQYVQGESVTRWIHRVDQALYQAKNQGRDQTVSV